MWSCTDASRGEPRLWQGDTVETMQAMDTARGAAGAPAGISRAEKPHGLGRLVTILQGIRPSLATLAVSLAVLLEVAGELDQRRIVLAVAEVDPDVRRELDRFGVSAKIGASHVFETLRDARAAFHRDARRTQS
jgi:hypothetical protein